MRQARGWRGWIGLAAVIGLPLGGSAAGAAAAADPVRVTFARSPQTTTIAPLVDGAEYFSNERYPVGKLPPEVAGMMFTRRPAGQASEVVVDAPAGSTVAVLVSSEVGAAKKNLDGIRRLHGQIEAAGFTRLADVGRTPDADARLPAVYGQTFATATRFTLPGGVWSGTVIAAKSLATTAAPAADAATPQQPAAPAAPTAAAAAGPPADVVRVHYALFADSTAFAPLVTGTPYFFDAPTPLGRVPAELAGMSFTRRPVERPSDVTVDVPAGATVGVLVNSERTATARTASAISRVHAELDQLGFTRLADVELTDHKGEKTPAVYVQTFAAARQFSVTRAVATGTVIVAKHLALDVGGADPAGATPTTPARPGPPVAAGRRRDGPATRVASQQATINALEVVETDAGLSLGRTSEVVLTVTREEAVRPVDVRFVEPVGQDTNLAKDEALRYVRLAYPTWDAGRAEITFEDKYDQHDGGSIGTAVGTMILSVVEGFPIDGRLAMTGDISANGRVRAVGGVAAKVAGATAAKCDLVAIPADNYAQLVDAVIYAGPSVVTDVQVLGMADLTDAVAAARTDRDPRLARAIAAFADLQQACHSSPAYLKGKAAAAQLHDVLGLAPRHLSARVLLDMNLGTAPRTLSVGGSEYHTAVAVRTLLTAMGERSPLAAARQMPSGLIRSGLADLRKLRPIADPAVRPLIDAWARFITTWNEHQDGGASAVDVERQRQALLDEMQKERADPKLMEKLLHEGA